MAMRLLGGAHLYRDAWNEKAPLHFVLAAQWGRAFGVTVTSLRALAATEMFVVLLLLARLVGGARWVAMATALLVAPWYQAHHGVQEATLAPLALATIEASTASGWLSLAAAGVLAASGCWVKQSFVAILPAFADETRPRLVVLAGATLAAALAWLAVFYLHCGDAIWQMPPFGQREAALPYVTGIWSEDKTILLVHTSAIVALILATTRLGSDVLTRRLAASAFWMALPALLRPGAFRAWPSAVLAIAAVCRVIASATPAQQRRWSAALLAPAIAVGVARIAIHDGNYSTLANVAARVDSLTEPGAPIWVGPHEALIYCLSGHHAATRVDFALPWSPAPSMRAALLEQLAAAPPQVIVDASDAYQRWQGRLEDSLPGIGSLLDSRYRHVDTIGGFAIWQRADPAAIPLPTAQPSHN
jgi:hypothetical protein